MTSLDFAKVVTVMIQSEKDTFKELIEKEAWQDLEDVIFEYAELAD